MALVSQDPFLFSSSLRDNITLGQSGVSPDDLERVIDAAQCRDLVRRLPQGLDTPLAEAGKTLSSGERQLIAIARALIRSPELIILDEATSYIDSQTEARIAQALERLTAQRTALVVAHRLSTARRADRILVLHHGRIIEQGSHDELMQLEGFYRRLVDIQGG
jgi:ATP-binding cassette subfamily B protein